MNNSLKAVFAEGGLKSTRKYEFGESDPLLECFKMIRDRAGKNPAVLIIDNLEMIFTSEPLMQELASIITLLDDSRYADSNVKLLIVGVPSGVKDYLAKSYTSVANRVAEISEVASLSRQEVSALVEKGFVDLLKTQFSGDTLKVWQEHVFRVTMGFAQPVQEYCEQLGYIVEDANWKADPSQLQTADTAWLKQGLSQASGLIALLMNERDTKVGRRNQVLFVLGRIEKRVFHVAEVESLVRESFPNSTTDTTLAVGQILSELTSDDNSIIRRSAKGPSYEFRDSRFAMALRVLLQKDDLKERVTKVF